VGSHSHSLVNGITVPSSSDLAARLLRTFFIATNPANWQNYASSNPWHITYPNVDVRVDIGVVNLPAVLNARYGNDIHLAPLQNPAAQAVGDNNGDTRTDAVMERAPLATGVQRRVDIGRGNPHAHWMSHDGHKMVTPNVLTGDTTQFDFPSDRIDSILPTSSPLSHPLLKSRARDIGPPFGWAGNPS